MRRGVLILLAVALTLAAIVVALRQDPGGGPAGPPRRLLARDPAGYATFVALLEDVGRAWATAATGHPGRRALPFHTVLVVPAHRLGARPTWGVPRLTG